jgi:hypothetical protein
MFALCRELLSTFVLVDADALMGILVQRAGCGPSHSTKGLNGRNAADGATEPDEGRMISRSTFTAYSLPPASPATSSIS